MSRGSTFCLKRSSYWTFDEVIEIYYIRTRHNFNLAKYLGTYNKFRFECFNINSKTTVPVYRYTKVRYPGILYDIRVQYI